VCAGDVSERMARRTAANLDKFFAGDVLFEEASAGADGDAPMAPDPMQCQHIRVRHWDATKRWPLPSSCAEAAEGAGMLVAGNLPWGGSLAGKEEDAAEIVLCLAREFPQATLCLIVPEIVRQDCVDSGSLWILHQAPVAKKAALLVCRGKAL